MASKQMRLQRSRPDTIALPDSAIVQLLQRQEFFSMNLGVCRIKIRLPENQSLKDKRKVLKSVISRVRNSYNVAIAEVDDQDTWQLATLGIACVSNDAQQNNKVLSKVVDFISQSRLDIEILDYEIEIIPFP
jgi:uncharacterized protein YlxP (DUF503 family)